MGTEARQPARSRALKVGRVAREGDKTAIASEQKMVKDEKKAFNVIKHLRAVIKAWRRQAQSQRRAQGPELFQSAFNSMQAGRKNFEKLLDAYNHMSLSLEKDEELLRKQREQEAKLPRPPRMRMTACYGRVKPPRLAPRGAFALPEDHSMGKLEG